ncbi:hypothetical protein HDU83_003172 [Entophlyctis luteolus]|nr:hypothetical protein HDU83_003172 [Entophlyctis luteolus]KAJ3380323.1 hypothetical protein HDU84_006021 [Entophlyctis sp. JEL0112]
MDEGEDINHPSLSDTGSEDDNTATRGERARSFTDTPLLPAEARDDEDNNSCLPTPRSMTLKNNNLLSKSATILKSSGQPSGNPAKTARHVTIKRVSESSQFPNRISDSSPSTATFPDFPKLKTSEIKPEIRLPSFQGATDGADGNIERSYTSLRKSANDLVDYAVAKSLARANTMSSRRGSSMSSLSTKVHPIIAWLKKMQELIMKSAVFRAIVRFLASDRTKILMWLMVLIIAHVSVTAVFIISLWVVMPGIWVYNFMQLFVIVCSLTAHEASLCLSSIIRTSITAGDLLRGRITVSQIADYWINGPKAPAQSIIRISTAVGTFAEITLVASSIFFSWNAIQSKLMTGMCVPPVYENATLPEGIDISNYVQGDIDFAQVYNYGLPLADGLVGGWPGWPLVDPMDSFQISGSGPVFVLQVLCDNGIPNPDSDPGIYTTTSLEIISSDNRGAMMQLTLEFPAQSVYDDVADDVANYTLVQKCTLVLGVGSGQMSFTFVADQWQMITNGQIVSVKSQKNEFSASYPTSINSYSTDAHTGFAKYPDTFKVLPIIMESITLLFGNNSFSPSQGASFCNLLSEGTWPDGYYHTSSTYRGVSVGIGAAVHFALMQYSSTTEPVSCDYYGLVGAGILTIPQIAIYLSASCSAMACLVKCFEIMWWFMAQTSLDYESYRRARRALRHPMRFAIDAAEMLATGMEAGERGDDICDATTTRAIEELGNSRIMYGEDIVTREMKVGHLRIAEYGKVKSILPGKKYGTYKPSQYPEWDEFVEK